MGFEITLSIGDIAAVVTIGVMIYGFQWKISKFFNKLCSEITILRTDYNNLKDRVDHMELRI